LPVFYISVLVLSIVAATILGDEVMNQTQEIGFAATNNVSELVFIFVALVIVAPLFEEMMMRGFLFGKLREYLSLWPSAILVSLVFALAHGQINVGIMTFVLSMFACRMREKTGAIWAGLFLHMTVNLVAYSVRFLGLGS
ncbi:MAG TPA: CPBP family intramembrane metalloprotease, partial [Candidatus Nanoperiomorbaceae bacterium]|nr:CPBP family intramembrane metalloprotease [Candidatus Nanoperiomorbaceae bacterium]